MVYSKQDIELMPRVQRLKLMNAISGIKPANLIGTVSSSGVSNLAIFSSVFHIGSNPALLGFIVRPSHKIPRHTYSNIMATGSYTINHVNSAIIKNAHYTSAKFSEHISEFERCGLTEEYINTFKAPFVEESLLKIGLKHIESIEIKLNKTILVVGEVEQLIIPNYLLDEEIDLTKINGIGISGLNTYYSLNNLQTIPYARVNEVPLFKT